ncbi:MAG: ACT domain-containing protein [Acidobacteria bacterium]|nr:ACT domain-containing protein [Acidobacteriota bacterium]
MAIRTELSLRLQNSPGALTQVSGILADEHVNIVALALESNGTLRLVIDNHVHAAGELRARHYDVQERDVLYIVMPNAPGSLARVGRLLAEAGVNLDYAYATAVEGGAMAAVVVGVPDAQRASAAAGV